MKQVLITGASGFLGKHLTATLRNSGVAVETVSSKTADLTDSHSTANIPVKDYDHIFHLAAWTQAGDFCAKRPGEQWIINQQINTNVLSWWKEHAPQAKMIAFGTSVSYAVEEGLSEEKYMDGHPNDKFYTYAMCKRMLLAGLQCLHKQYDMQYLYLVPSTMYGPGYHLDGRQMHFIYDLARKILNGKLYGTPVTLWGDGEQRRELVYVDDFIHNMLALNAVAANDVFNIGGGEDNSIKDFANIICSITGYNPQHIGYDTAQYVGARSKILDIEKYRKTVGKEPQRTPLQTGIAKTIDWIMEHKERLLAG